jgi:hypothetical protein
MIKIWADKEYRSDMTEDEMKRTLMWNESLSSLHNAEPESEEYNYYVDLLHNLESFEN